MYQKHEMQFIRFEDNNAFVQAGFSGPDLPVGEEEEVEEGWDG